MKLALKVSLSAESREDPYVQIRSLSEGNQSSAELYEKRKPGLFPGRPSGAVFKMQEKSLGGSLRRYGRCGVAGKGRKDPSDCPISASTREHREMRKKIETCVPENTRGRLLVKGGQGKLERL